MRFFPAVIKKGRVNPSSKDLLKVNSESNRDLEQYAGLTSCSVFLC